MGANDVQIQIIGRDLATAAFRTVNSAAASTTAQITSLGQATSGLNQVFTSAAGFAAGIAGFNGITTAIQGTIGAIFSFKKSMEVHETGMAGILLSMTEINGRTLSWGESISLSKNIMQQLNVEALRTAATTEELTNAFRGILGPALNAKMTIDEIVQLSSAGVNAVKSIMPNNGDVQRQIVQELRDLVAGGIQPASSTLATALGLKDKDIKEAKASSEGLFKFLMDRLKGFEIAAPAYARTWQGIQDQIKEGITLSGSRGLDPVFGALKEEMAAVASQIIVFNQETGKMQVNPELVGTFREISDTLITGGREVKSLAQDIGVVAVPAAKLLGGAIKLAVTNAESLTYAIGGWVAIRKLSVIFADAKAVAAGATQAQTFLGKAVLDTQTKYAQQAAVAAQAAAAERQAALAAAQAQIQATLAGTTAQTAAMASILGQRNLSAVIQATVAERNLEAAAATRTAEIINAANMAAKIGQYEVAQAILATNLSLNEQSAYAAVMAERMAFATMVAKTGQLELAQSILAANIELSAQGVTAATAGEQSAAASSAAIIAQRDLAASIAATTAAQVEGGVAAAAAGTRMVSSMAVANTAVGNILRTVWALVGGWVGVAAATGYAIYKLSEYMQKKDGLIEGYDPDAKVYKKQRTQFINGKEQTTNYYVKDTDEYETVVDPINGDVSYRHKQVELSRDETEKLLRHQGKWTESSNPYVDMSAITSKYTAGDDGKAAAKAAKAAERAYEEKQRLLDKNADMIAKMNAKINEETGTTFESSSSKLSDEVANMKRELDKSKIDFAKYGIDVSGVYAKIGEYQGTMTAKIERQRSQAFAGLAADTATITAGISGDPKIQAEAEYQKELTRIKKDRENDEIFKKTAKGSDDLVARKAADDYYAAQKEAALKKRNDKTREANLQQFDLDVQHNNMLVQLEGKTHMEVDRLNQQTLQAKIIALDIEIAKATTTKEERIRLEQERVAATEQIQQISSRNMATAATEAIRQINDEQNDYTNDMMQTWNEVNNKTSEHFKNMLTGAEHLGEGIKGTMKDISASIADMFAQMAYQQMIYQPLKDWFNGILSGFSGKKNTGSNSGSDTSGTSDFSKNLLNNLLGKKYFAEGGYYPGGLAMVGEKGPELINFANPGQVYTASQTKNILKSNSASNNSASSGGNTINFYISSPNVESFRQSQGQMYAEAHRALNRGRRNM